MWGMLWGPGVALGADISAARYADPTTRYDHAVLGDAVEWSTLEMTLTDGTRRRAELPGTLVFEDLAPRLADLDGDGSFEVITVESSLTAGARLSVWGPGGRIAATPHIGQRHRWLAPVGAADLDGDGRIEIAYIDRPHLAGLVRVWRLENDTLVPVTDLAGFSNHRIGWDHIPGGIRDCGAGPEIIAADIGWSEVRAIRMADGRLTHRSLGRYRGPHSLDDAMACLPVN